MIDLPLIDLIVSIVDLVFYLIERAITAVGIIILCFYDVVVGYFFAILAGAISIMIFAPKADGIPLFADILFWIVLITISLIRIIKTYKEFKM